MSDSTAVRETEHATITYEESLDAVCIEWKRVASDEAFREVLERGLETVRDTRAANWFADLREMGTVHPDDQEWVNEEWFPRALSTPLARMALVEPEGLVRKRTVDNVMREVGDGLVSRYFADPAEARDWLRTEDR